MPFLSNKYNHCIFLIIFFFFLCHTAFAQVGAQTEAQAEAQTAAREEPQSDSIFIINSFNFKITGLTRPDALIRKGELKTGVEIAGFQELEKYIHDKTQLLYNERVLDSVNIDYTVGPLREDGKFPVDIVITSRDTWNIVAIPRPRYSSNTGFDITLKARDYNFLGTMSPLRIDLGYSYDENKNNSFFFMFDSNIPFTAYGLNWNIKFYNDFTYRPDTELPIYNGNITGLSVELPAGFTIITAGINESFILNEENEDVYKPEYGYFQNGFYMSTNPYISWKIPTGIDAGGFGEIIFTPGVSAIFNHEFSEWPLDDIRKGPVLIFKQNLGFSRIDWIGNLRNGMDVYIYNSLDYNFYKANNGKNPWTDKLIFSGIGHFKITDFFGISTNLMYRQWIFYDYGYAFAGDVLRGVIDKDIFADYMLSLNFDLSFRLLKFTPSVWFNKQKLRLFNFELFSAPFIDLALYKDPINKTEFDIKNIAVTGGFEVIVFPEFFRSLFIRASIGWNLKNISDAGDIEIYIGTDFFY
ncbi:MAG: hypothetical protein LBV17_07795 [Treponema sp.]|nr:hypothetical protein [Treponema sp.]